MIKRISRLHYDNGEIGRLVHKARLNGFSMKRIAQECGVTPMTVYHWFYGRRKPRGNQKNVVRRHLKNLIENRKPKAELQDGVVNLIKDMLDRAGTRKSRTLKADEIADALKVSRRTIYKWTSGEAKPYHPEEKIPVLRFINEHSE